MKRELDEIEAEMGKESMKYVCDHAGACERKPCYHEGKHEAVKACDPPRSGLKGCDHLHSKCIPVEPERVAGISGRCAAPANSECSHAGPSDQFCKYCTYWKPAEPERVSAVECSRANARCPVGRQYFEAGGKHFCHSRTSPCPHTWAQRMGMCVWPEEQWIVTSLDFGWYTTEEKAMEYVRQNPNKRRAFRWQDGVQG